PTPDTNFDILSQNSSFSAYGLPACCAYADTIYTTLTPTVSLTNISRSLILLTSTTFSNHFSATRIPILEDPSLQPVQKNLYLCPSPSKILALCPFHFVSCKQQKSNPRLSTNSITSPLFLTIVPTFKLPNLNPIPPANRRLRSISPEVIISL